MSDGSPNAADRQQPGGPTTPQPPSRDWQNTLVVIVYELLGPAVLGSMLYELVSRGELLRFAKWAEQGTGDWIKLGLRVLVVVNYCMSWLYLRRFRDPQRARTPLSSRQKVAFCAIDLVTPFAYAVAFAFAGDGDFPCTLSAGILVVAGLYLVAQLARNSPRLYGVGCSSAAVAVMAVDLCLRGAGLGPVWDLIALGLIAALFVYFLAAPSASA